VNQSIAIPAVARSGDVVPALIGWGTFLVFFVLQCLAHQVFVSRVAVDLIDSIIWASREWGIWLAISPILLRCVRHAAHAETKTRYVLMSLGCLALALGFRVAVNVFEAAQEPFASLAFFFPKYLGAWLLVIVAGLGLLSLRAKHQAERSPAVSEEPLRSATTLLVTKGRDECLIELNRIDSFSAAKNYVEVRCGKQTYLLRSTLKQIEERLPPGEFIRTHRSHIVRIRAVHRVRMLPSGTGVVVLEDGTELGLSKKYYRSLDRYRPSALPA
jgi:LytTr DNA-binding domain